MPAIGSDSPHVWDISQDIGFGHCSVEIRMSEKIYFAIIFQRIRKVDTEIGSFYKIYVCE